MHKPKCQLFVPSNILQDRDNKCFLSYRNSDGNKFYWQTETKNRFDKDTKRLQMNPWRKHFTKVGSSQTNQLCLLFTFGFFSLSKFAFLFLQCILVKLEVSYNEPNLYTCWWESFTPVVGNGSMMSRKQNTDYNQKLTSLREPCEWTLLRHVWTMWWRIIHIPSLPQFC